MKFNLLAAAVITAFAVGSANAALPDSWTVGGAVGWSHGFDHKLNGSFYDVNGVYSDSHFDDDGYGTKIYGEYNFNNWFSLGLAWDYIGDQNFTSYYGITREAFHLNIAELYGKFAYTFDTKGSDVFFKVGPTYNRLSALGESENKLGAVAGVGVQYAFTNSFAVRAGYDYFYHTAKIGVEPFDDDARLDEGLLYLGFQYTFGGAQPAAPVAKKKVKTTQTHTLDAGVLFPFDSSKLSAEGQSAVSTVVQSANQLEEAEFEVYGYTDRIGSDAYNNKLSQKRADAVSSELQNNGVAAKVSEGKGKANPVTGNKCDGVKGRKALIDCLAPDRRVEVVVTGLTSEVK
ncbi:OmpA-OmpF porin, OOP family [Succinivibrio dextrinosolvens]|uniref:OmpA family protein n=1 Tax=Succinivibrio dextrinosolvens TaxID=83771 RepID=UPI0008E52239|nr:OmpA family protein [Succinivibrio dextrinosolvens]SFS74673.1 OmpA-OmpF porin, OOP family [Succinivibrio dextrinosolvens]